ncbi:heavy metal-associated isoprenylated plant protein 33-like [Olea europaea var. sylvestris]|uniref:heavy metal-associated isoprenylated plant protein 33-like n=1 Tax=Olea europaea var. sylvestris TaxID=158386 RepID=UPI000C1D4572|nr:heavy metal-associated isoprenylated plant protein 33-like [Olea europaea var. sylvestris]
MSKEEFLKIQTCVLKVNVHCDGCKHKVKKILQKIEGVYTTNIDAEQGKVTVSGNVDPTTLIKKLAKRGKYAELWRAPKANNNQQNQLNNQFKNLQIGNEKGQSNKNPNQKGANPQPKGGQNPQHQQLKGIQDLKMPFNAKDQNQKSVKFNVPEIDESDDDEFDDSDYDEFDDEMDDVPLNKMKPVMGNGHGGGQIPKMMNNNMMNMQHPQFMKGGANGGYNGGNADGNGKMMINNMMKGQHPQFMKGDANGGGNNGGNAKKGGGAGNIPMQVNFGGTNDGKSGANFCKKGGNGNNNSCYQNQGGGKGGKNGGAQPQDGKNGGGNGGQNKNGNNVNGGGANGAKKGNGMNDGFHVMPNMMAMNAGGSMGQMGNMPMGQMRPLNNPQMGNVPAVQGLPTSAMNGGGGFQGLGIEHMAGNPYYQQQLAAMMMNQQRANGNERFQPMMYARPPPAVSYMPPYPPYPYPRHPGEQPDQYSMFSDENTSSCSMM